MQEQIQTQVQPPIDLPKKPKPRKHLIFLGIGLLILLILGAGYRTYQETKIKESLQAALAKGPQTAEDTEVFVISGILSPIHTYNISTKVSGQITEVSVTKGEHIKANTVLARQDPTDVKLASGQGSTTDELLQRLKIAYDTAKDTYEKNKELFDAGAIAQTVLDQSAVQMENARLQYEGTAKYILEQTGKTIIKSPGQGIVTSLNIQAGDYAGAGTPIATITDTSQVILKGNVFESWLSYLKPKAKVDVYIDTLDKTYEGIVTYISPVAVSSGQMFPVEITINNELGELRAGMTASCTLRKESEKTED
ncbi:MAG TPA: efflux RND transporter periplasmic adaptor subunit [Peptococcaceae bacterium]|nr:efflux RND transporter periplasmic adaptor subunit [Peptococcaceae bacterium]